VRGKTAVVRSARRAAALPSIIEPCLATLVDNAPSGHRWLHEVKWDGYRVLAHVADHKPVLRTRRGLDWTARFPTIAEAIARLPVASAVLDGEAVVENDKGLPDFSALQAALGVRNVHGDAGYKAAPEASGASDTSGSAKRCPATVPLCCSTPVGWGSRASSRSAATAPIARVGGKIG